MQEKKEKDEEDIPQRYTEDCTEIHGDAPVTLCVSLCNSV